MQTHELKSQFKALLQAASELPYNEALQTLYTLNGYLELKIEALQESKPKREYNRQQKAPETTLFNSGGKPTEENK